MIPVLMYHQVCKEGTFIPSPYTVSVGTFRRQLEYMVRRGFYTPPLGELLANNGCDAAGRKPILLTFDDGYLNNYEFAFPLLQEFGFSALISLVADPAIRTNTWDRLKGMAKAPLMEDRHVREMAAYGIEFASHSYRHPSLPALRDSDLRWELQRSKERIEEILGRPVEALVYPYGDVDERVKHAAQEAGYRCAFATHSGPLDFFADLFEIRRMLIVDSADPLYLGWVLSGGKKTLMWGIGIAKKLLGKRNRFQGEIHDSAS